MRRGLVIGIAFVAAVVAATVIGVVSVSTLGSGTGGPLSQREVEDRLARTSPSPSPPSPPPSPSPGGAASGAAPAAASPSAVSSPVRRYYITTGGSLWATCADGTATLDTLTPRSGYRLDGSHPGPGEAAWVRFKVDVRHGHADEYLVTVVCRNGVPQMTETGDG